MKKVLLSSVAALAVFAAVAPAFAEGKDKVFVDKSETPALNFNDLPKTGQEAPKAATSAATEKHPGATQVDPSIGKGTPVDKKGDVSTANYDGNKFADTSKELTAVPAPEYFTQGLDLWNGSQHGTFRTEEGVQTIEVTNPHDGTKWLVDVQVKAGANTPSGFYATAISGSLRPASSDAKAAAKAAEEKAEAAKAGKDGKASSAKAGEKSLPKTSAVK
ncbi:LPKTxAVK-anchored surface protein [Streptococcus sp. 20925_1_77]|uniref:LPKTxAVK-anchored surface protein n=1 Tax=Streptococcus sp. 20925_1_77 TaxID=3003654 RepID=UPI00352E112B